MNSVLSFESAFPLRPIFDKTAVLFPVVYELEEADFSALSIAVEGCGEKTMVFSRLDRSSTETNSWLIETSDYLGYASLSAPFEAVLVSTCGRWVVYFDRDEFALFGADHVLFHTFMKLSERDPKNEAKAFARYAKCAVSRGDMLLDEATLILSPVVGPRCARVLLEGAP